MKWLMDKIKAWWCVSPASLIATVIDVVVVVFVLVYVRYFANDVLDVIGALLFGSIVLLITINTSQVVEEVNRWKNRSCR